MDIMDISKLKNNVEGMEVVIKSIYSEIISRKLRETNQKTINIKQCKSQIAQ
jgi:hypothetical protein